MRAVSLGQKPFGIQRTLRPLCTLQCTNKTKLIQYISSTSRAGRDWNVHKLVINPKNRLDLEIRDELGPEPVPKILEGNIKDRIPNRIPKFGTDSISIWDWVIQDYNRLTKKLKVDQQSKIYQIKQCLIFLNLKFTQKANLTFNKSSPKI